MLCLIAIDLSDSSNESTDIIKHKKRRFKYDRDASIFRLFKAGVKIDKIARIYDLTIQRINDIIDKQRLTSSEGNPDIYEIDMICRILGWRENDRGKLQSILHKNGYTSFDDKWKDLTLDDILAIPYLGKDSAMIIWLAQNV